MKYVKNVVFYMTLCLNFDSCVNVQWKQEQLVQGLCKQGGISRQVSTIYLSLLSITCLIV